MAQKPFDKMSLVQTPSRVRNNLELCPRQGAHTIEGTARQVAPLSAPPRFPRLCWRFAAPGGREAPEDVGFGVRIGYEAGCGHGGEGRGVAA